MVVEQRCFVLCPHLHNWFDTKLTFDTKPRTQINPTYLLFPSCSHKNTHTLHLPRHTPAQTHTHTQPVTHTHTCLLLSPHPPRQTHSHPKPTPQQHPHDTHRNAHLPRPTHLSSSTKNLPLCALHTPFLLMAVSLMTTSPRPPWYQRPRHSSGN